MKTPLASFYRSRFTGDEPHDTRQLPGATIRRLWFYSCAAVLAVLIAGCSGVNPRFQTVVLAQVNQESITVQDLEDAFTGTHRGHGIFLAGKGSVSKFLEKVIDNRLLLQEAKRIGLDQDADLQKALEVLRGKRAQEAYFRDEVLRKVSIPEEAILAAYEEMGTRFQASHIFVENREDSVSALERIKAGEEFGEVARQVSQAPTARKGGYLGVVRWGELDLPLEKKLWSLEKGQVSEPFQDEKGWNLLYAIERVSVERSELEKARASIKVILTRRDKERLSDSLFRNLMARWEGMINKAVLRVVIKARDREEMPLTMVIAEAGGEEITLGQFLRRLSLDRVRQHSPSWALMQMGRLLEERLFRILLRKEALARGYGERPEIASELERLRDRLALDLLLSKVVYANLHVSDEQAEEYYQAHPKEFTEPEAVNLSIILLESEEEARAVMVEIKDGKDFASLARKRSKDQNSAAFGGEGGWVTKGRIQPDLEKAVFSIKEGELGIASTPAGTYVIRIEKRRESRLKPFGEVKEKARQAALRQKAREARRRWVTKLRAASMIVIDDEAISSAIASYENTLRQKSGRSREGATNPDPKK